MDCSPILSLVRTELPSSLASLAAVRVMQTARGRQATPAPARVERCREEAAAASHKLRAVTVSQVPRRSVAGASTSPVISVRFLDGIKRKMYERIRME